MLIQNKYNFVLVSTTLAARTEAKTSEMSKYRLPTSVKPTLYDLYLFPDLQTGKRLFSVQLFCIRYQQHKTDINLLNNIYL